MANYKSKHKVEAIIKCLTPLTKILIRDEKGKELFKGFSTRTPLHLQAKKIFVMNVENNCLIIDLEKEKSVNKNRNKRTRLL